MKIPLSPESARNIVNGILNDKENEVISLETRIGELRAEYDHDPWEGTAAQLERLKLRLVHRRLEVEALGIILK